FGTSTTIRHGEVTLTPEKLQKMLKEYYQLRDWEVSSGRPTPQKLKKLDLAEVAGELPA
ncbi:MAG: hypothetical protein JRJ59_03815, partial [Deltaproteobacteria bacterium]|nr:hypothetical protein [Deltaproteobacteria bacterium]